MALTPKERERIVEEEKLRYETRQTLHRESCAKHKPSRKLWWIGAIVLGYLAYCHFVCGDVSCAWGKHGGMMNGKHCTMHEPMLEGAAEPGQPVPAKK